MKILKILQEVVEDDTRFKIQAELDSIIQKYEAMGVDCWIYLKGNDAIEVSSIKVKDKTQRRQGLGTALMSEITALCDKYGLLCVLTPEDEESSKSGLLRFYKRFGFVSNTGRNKDFRFRNTMIRFPNKNIV
jgi:GNAT superfamily N-acetyltransferase